MSITHTIKRTWSSGGSTPISYAVSQTGGVEANLDLTIPGSTTNSPEVIAITVSGLQSLFVASNQAATMNVNGVNAQWTITPTSVASPSDVFHLIFGAQTTAAITFGSDGATVGAAFAALSSVGAGNAVGTGPANGPWIIEFTGALGLQVIAGSITTGVITSPDTMTLASTRTGVAATQSIALAAGVPIDWTKDDPTSNPLTGDVTKLSFTVAGTATAAVQLRSLGA